ncbi:MAG: protein-disulfide reductase DsbD family protein [Planctomycetaceae bacterium]
MGITRTVCFAVLSILTVGSSDGRAQSTAKPAAPPATNPRTVVPAADEQGVVSHMAFRPVLTAEPVGPFAKGEDEKPLKVKIYPMFNKLPSNDKCLIAIELQVAKGWHVNANPSHPDYLVPTTIELKSSQKVKLTKTKFPRHHTLDVAGEDKPYHVYDGNAIVYGLLEVQEPATTEFAELEFHVRYQGCNSVTCLPPDLVVMKGKLPLAQAGEELKKINIEKFPKRDDSESTEAGGKSADSAASPVESPK